jgi:hypothetical protein
MPPQGSVLSDENVAAILTHVRSSWGNQFTAVSPELVKSLREQTSKREKPWGPVEILKLHPLEIEPSALKNLTSQTYLGNWRDLPDFSQLKAENIEEEHDGIIDLDQSMNKTDGFGMVWQADFEAPKDGEYSFYFDADDGGRVAIAGKTLAEIRGLGPMNGGRAKTAKISLTKGSHPIRIEYFEFTQNQGVQLGWKGPEDKQWRWVSKQTSKPTKKWPDIPLTPTADRAIIYRNFIAGTSPRAIGVGFPGGLNLAWSADHLGPELIWTGKFMDAGRHWTDRGQGNEPPAGGDVVQLSKGFIFPVNAKFKGYSLDSAGNPTFKIQIGEHVLTDSWKPGSVDSQPALMRELSLSEGGPPVEICLCDQFAAKRIDDQNYSINDRIWVRAERFQPETNSDKTYLKLPAGKSATLSYRWKK